MKFPSIAPLNVRKLLAMTATSMVVVTTVLCITGAVTWLLQFSKSAALAAYQITPVKLPTLNQQDHHIQFFDRYGHFICTIHPERDCQPVRLADISINLRNAVLTAEDRHFYKHHGFSPLGMIRAYKRNREAGRVVEGGSTITQQLVKNLYFNKNERTYNRKIREILLSMNIEHDYSKSKILETYLNEIYFGSGAFGIERAANIYFDKHASHLDLAESAYLAGLIKSPSVLGNPGHLGAARKRQQEILSKMEEFGFSQKADADLAKQETLAFRHCKNAVPYPCYIAYALEAVRKEMGDEIGAHNLKVYTNLDPAAQRAASAILPKSISRAPSGINQAALVTISNKDGAVLSMVGGVNEDQCSWNRATHPHTAGSCFKPFVYLTALMKNDLQTDSLIDDQEMKLKLGDGTEWAPKNSDNTFKGWLTVRDALAYSRNICAVRVAQTSGIDAIVETARATGISRARLDSVPSLALGACAVSPLEMATAYSTLARYGVCIPPQVVRSISIDDKTGDKAADSTARRELTSAASNNLPSESVAQLVDIMQDVVNKGTGYKARLAGIPVAGKTGTADGARDVWFSGFTPDVTTVVWAGSDKNCKVRGSNITGGTVAASIWKEYMTAFYSLHKPNLRKFDQPEVRLVQSIPKYSDATLLTTDITTVANPSEIAAPAAPATLDNEQVAANVPTILQNESVALDRGIGKAFVIEAGEAARRWQHANQSPADVAWSGPNSGADLSDASRSPSRADSDSRQLAQVGSRM